MEELQELIQQTMNEIDFESIVEESKQQYYESEEYKQSEEYIKGLQELFA